MFYNVVCLMCLNYELYFQMKKRISECDNNDEDSSGRKEKDHRKNKSKKKAKKEEDDEEEINVSPEMQQNCSFILEHLNLKMQLVMWKPK